MNRISTTALSSAMTLTLAASAALAEDPVGWSLAEIQGSTENSCFASYHDLESNEHDNDWMSEARGASVLSQLPIGSELSVEVGEAISAASSGILAETTSDSLWIDCYSDAAAIGPSTGVYHTESDAWASAELFATISLDGPKDVHFRGLVAAHGMEAGSEASVRVERVSDGLLIWEWKAMMSDVDIDLKSTLASGDYRISVLTGGFVVAGAEFVPTAGINQHAWLELSIEPMTLDPDLNGDQVVNGLDLGLLFADWGLGNSPADLNLDGRVDGADMGMMFAHWE